MKRGSCWARGGLSVRSFPRRQNFPNRFYCSETPKPNEGKKPSWRLLLGSVAAAFSVGYYIHQTWSTYKENKEKETDTEEVWRAKSVAQIKGKWHQDDVAAALEQLKKEDLLGAIPDTLLGRVQEVRLLDQVRSSPNYEKYLVVVGEKGVGKSTLVHAAFHDKEGILYTNIPSDLKPDDLRSAFFEATNYPIDKFPLHNSWKFLATLCNEAKVKIKIGEEEKEVPPLLLVEVNSRSTEDNLVRELCGQIKWLVYDKKAARAVIVLSDALAAQNLTPDPSRRKVLWLGDLSDTDAGLYLEKMNFSHKVKAELETEKKDYYEENPLEFVKYVEQRKREIFEQVGTHPSILNDLMTSELTTQKFIEKELSDASNKIDRSVLANPRWAAAYKKLLSKEPLDDFLTWSEIGAATNLTPKDILAAVKEFHALTFDVEKQVFSFYSPAVRTAAKKRGL